MIATPMKAKKQTIDHEYLGYYLEGNEYSHEKKPAKIRGFLVEVRSEVTGVLHSGQLICLDQDINILWERPAHCALETYLPILGKPLDEQIDILLTKKGRMGWKRVQEIKELQAATHERDYKSWHVGLVFIGQDLAQCQISNAVGWWTFTPRKPIRETQASSYALAETAIDFLDSVFCHLPAIAILDQGDSAILGNSADEGMFVGRVPIDLIRTDGKTQTRVTLDEDAIDGLAQGYSDGDDIPPIKLMWDGACYWLYDGYHRLDATLRILTAYDAGELKDGQDDKAIEFAQDTKERGFQCEIRKGTLKDAQWASFSQNVNHGVRRSRADIPNIVGMALNHPYAAQYSYRSLAAITKIDPKTFSKWWRSLAEEGKVPPPPDEITVNRNGSVYTMTRTFATHTPKENLLSGSDVDQTENNLEGFVDQEEAEEPVAPIQVRVALPLPVTPASEPEPVIPQITVSLPPVEPPKKADKSGNEKYTPPQWKEFAEAIFGRGIELDPASCELANTVMQAERIYTIEQDGLTQDWEAATVWLNPPYSVPEVQQFASKLLDELPVIGQCLLLVNACTETNWFQALAKTADWLFFPNERINFWRKDDDPTDFDGRNEYRQCFMYWGDRPDEILQFENTGLIVYPLSSDRVLHPHKPQMEIEA